MIIYGSELCPDCREALELLKGKEDSFECRDICTSLKFMKEFLHIRDNSAIFDGIKSKQGIGIPLFVFPDGYMTLDTDDALEKFEG